MSRSQVQCFIVIDSYSVTPITLLSNTRCQLPPSTYDGPTRSRLLLAGSLVLARSSPVQRELSLHWLDRLVELPGWEGEGPGELPVLVVVTVSQAIARVLWLCLHSHFGRGGREGLSLSLDQRGRRRRRIAWVSHWGRRDKPPRQVLWLRQALVYTLGHLLEPLPVMSSQRCLLVTVVMVRGMVVVVVWCSTYLIHSSDDSRDHLTVTSHGTLGLTLGPRPVLNCSVCRSEPSSRLRLRHCSLPLSAAPSTTDCFHTLRSTPGWP